ncbi:hypothetical protein ACJMK2_044134 [Sinanodonta woodiana]|uniref:Uncharacterized protein n=1 Tax=Sinanodonta woodiana TaxID=1069815 RepID=A0ABD3VZM9_SINWO
MDACKAISLFNIHSNRHGAASLALKLGQSLQKCAQIIVSQAIENQDKDLQVKVEEFIKLLEINWTEEIASNALKTLHEGKRNTSHKMLPLADNVKSLTDYLKKMAEENTYKSLISSTEKNAVKKYWVELSEIVLAQTILFNRRRAGNVSKMTIEKYTNTHKADIDDTITNSLTDLEKAVQDLD